jgi:hypothetical protein
MKNNIILLSQFQSYLGSYRTLYSVLNFTYKYSFFLKEIKVKLFLMYVFVLF